MKNLAKAIIAVMQSVHGMEKNSRVGKGSSAYDGTKDQDVKEVFNRAFVENGLCILPIGIDETTQVDRWDGADYKGNPTKKQSIFTKVKTTYLLLHESGESQVVCGYGHGADPLDKGAGKATTYALKNTLLLAFLTPVGKMPDADLEHSDSYSVPETGGSGSGAAGQRQASATEPPRGKQGDYAAEAASMIKGSGGNPFLCWLDTAKKGKEFLGEEQYRVILKAHGVEKANMAGAPRLFALIEADLIIAIATKIKKEKEAN